MNSSKKYIIGGIAILALAASGYWYLSTRVNHLIPGVPYYGIYDGFMDYQNNMVTNTMMILDYYGDERFSPHELLPRFKANGADRDIDWIDTFFREAGYETYVNFDVPQGEAIKYIKKFVNSEQNVPIVIEQKRSPDPKFMANVLRLVIGVFDGEKKLVIHDYSFGNNHEVSYQDFENKFGSTHSVFAAWPSEELKSQLKGIDASQSYSPRLPVMDEIGPYLAGNAADIRLYHIKWEEDPEAGYDDFRNALESFVQDPRLEKLHPLARMEPLLGYARVLWAGGMLDEAAKFIETEILPMNKDLDESYNGWHLHSHMVKNGKVAMPWVHLARIYIRQQQGEKALKALEEAWKIDTSDFYITEELYTAYEAYENICEAVLKRRPNNPVALRGLEIIKTGDRLKSN